MAVSPHQPEGGASGACARAAMGRATSPGSSSPAASGAADAAAGRADGCAARAASPADPAVGASRADGAVEGAGASTALAPSGVGLGRHAGEAANVIPAAIAERANRAASLGGVENLFFRCRCDASGREPMPSRRWAVDIVTKDPSPASVLGFGRRGRGLGGPGTVAGWPGHSAPRNSPRVLAPEGRHGACEGARRFARERASVGRRRRLARGLEVGRRRRAAAASMTTAALDPSGGAGPRLQEVIENHTFERRKGSPWDRVGGGYLRSRDHARPHTHVPAPGPRSLIRVQCTFQRARLEGGEADAPRRSRAGHGVLAARLTGRSRVVSRRRGRSSGCTPTVSSRTGCWKATAREDPAKSPLLAQSDLFFAATHRPRAKLRLSIDSLPGAKTKRARR